MGKKLLEMDEEERKKVCAKLEWEGGLEYLINGSDFPDIEDKHFHNLRKSYVFAANQLYDYLRYDEFLDDDTGDVNEDSEDI